MAWDPSDGGPSTSKEPQGTRKGRLSKRLFFQPLTLNSINSQNVWCQAVSQAYLNHTLPYLTLTLPPSTSSVANPYESSFCYLRLLTFPPLETAKSSRMGRPPAVIIIARHLSQESNPQSTVLLTSLQTWCPTGCCRHTMAPDLSNPLRSSIDVWRMETVPSPGREDCEHYTRSGDYPQCAYP